MNDKLYNVSWISIQPIQKGWYHEFYWHRKRRYACRTYRADKVEKEKLDLILEAAHVAPTGANRQPQKLIVVQEKKA